MVAVTGQPVYDRFRGAPAQLSAFDHTGRAEGAILRTAAPGLHWNPPFGADAVVQPCLGRRQGKGIKVGGNRHRPMRPRLSRQVTPRQINPGWRGPLGAIFKPAQQTGKRAFALALDTHIRFQVRQRTFRQDAEAGATEHNRSAREASAQSDDLLQRPQQKLRVAHRLVVDVSHREANHLGAQRRNCILRGRFPVGG